MSDEELKEMWAGGKKTGAVSFNASKLSDELDNKLESSKHVIQARNNREIYTAFALMPIFLMIAVFVHPLLSKAGALLIIPYCGLVIYVLKRVQRYKNVDASLPLREYLAQYRDYLCKERYLLQMAGWWYIIPAIFCMSLFFIGLQKYIALVPLLLVGAIGWYYNSKGARDYFDPLLEKIDADIIAIESDLE